MTLTETRPTAASADAAPVPAPVDRGALSWLTSADHKRIGLLFAAGGLFSLLVACVPTFLYALPGFGGTAEVFVRPASRLAASATALAFVIGIPALWIGLATYVVPLQIGGHRLAMPRLHSFALWCFAGGGGLVALAYVVDDLRFNSLASSVPPAAIPGQPATNATELLLAGLAIVAIGTLLAAANLLVTILNRRAEGMRLLHVPAFTWGTLGTSLTLVLSTPVFLAGLVLLYLDQHYGGSLFAVGRGGLRIWQHELWLPGRPESLVFFAASIGIYCDIVATALRRPLVGWPIARAASVAAPLLTLLAFAGATSVLRSPLAPLATVGAVLFLVPAGLAVLTWLASGRGARPRLVPGAVPLLAHFVLDGVLIVFVVAAVLTDVEGAEAAAFRNGMFTAVALGHAMLGLGAGYLHWAPKLRGRTPTLAAAGASALLLLGAGVLIAAPGYLVGLGADDGVAVIASVGAAALALGLLTLAPTIAGPAGSAPGDPYEGLTLEWAAASPPARHNFEEVPEIRSAYPLHDARVAAQAPAAAGEEGAGS